MENSSSQITRIEFFGDSIIRGTVWAGGKLRLRDGRDFPGLAAQGFAVRNNGMIGATIRKGAEVLGRRLPALGRDTLVIMGFGGNDCDHDWQAISDDPAGVHLPKVSVQEFRERYEGLVEQAKATGAKVALCSLVPLDADKFFDHISARRSAANILEWLGDKEILYRWHENYSRVVERVAATCGCGLVDVRDGFLVSHDFRGLLGPDGIHPTEAGYRLIDDILAGDVEELTALPAMA